MAQSTLTPGPGTVVRDAIAPKLVDALSTPLTATQAGSWVEVPFPKHASIELVTGAVADAGVQVDVEIFAADDSSGNGQVSLGRFSALTDADDNVTRWLDVVSHKRYMKADVTISGGTSPSVALAVTVRNMHDGRGDSRSA